MKWIPSVKPIFVLSVFCFLFGTISCKQSQAEESKAAEPIGGVDSEIAEKEELDPQPLYDISQFEDAGLQQQLNQLIKSNSLWAQLATNGKLALGVMDLSDGSHPKFANINGNNMMYAASLPKIAILFAAEYSLHDGSLQSTPELEKDMRLMISKSNNQAATRVLDRVGMKRIAEILQKDEYKFYDKENGGGLWVGKRYSSSGATNRDPLKNLSHAATADQVVKYYYLLYTRQLICKTCSDHMLSMLVDPELTHKFVYTLRKIAPDAKIYRKSGTWSTWHADSVMVESDEKDYILVALINDGRGEQIIRNITEPLANLISSK